MQSGFAGWLALPIPVVFASLFAFYLATAALLVWLSFSAPLKAAVQSINAVVAPFFGSVAIIFGLLVALITLLAIAVVHLERPRPQAAALFIFTLAAVSLLGLLAIHEAPFDPPVFVPPGSIVDVLRQVPT